MDDFKVLVINESNAKSVISDIFTYVGLMACFFINYNFLGNSTIITLLISVCFFLGIWGKGTKKINKMTPDEALEYLRTREKERKP